MDIYKMASLDWNTNDTFSYETFIAPRVKTELYSYKDENSALQDIIIVLGGRVFDYYHKYK